jgi:hypothetical protein
VAASVGLTPDQVYGMTFREIELYAQGQRDRDDWLLEVLAWVQANLINIHIPRGKPRVRPDTLLPRSTRRRRADTDDTAIERVEEGTGSDPKARMEALKRRVRARVEREDQERFWSGAEGRRMLSLLGEPEE